MDFLIDPISSVDPIGRVFHWNKNIYRGINHKYSLKVREIMSLKNLQNIFKAGLIETEISNDLIFPPYDLILKHKKIDFLTYFVEWNTQMLLDVALMLLDLGEELEKNNFMFSDCTTYNISFDYTIPKFIDFGAIKPLNNCLGSLWDTFLYLEIIIPLCKQLGLKAKDFNLVRQGSFSKVREWLKSKEPIVHPLSNYKVSSYQEDITLLRQLKDKGAETLHDIGAHRSIKAESIGYKVVASSLDRNLITEIYKIAKKDNLKITPVILDPKDITKTYRARSHIYPSAKERFKCDVILQ